jgi:hypothetical protein
MIARHDAHKRPDDRAYFYEQARIVRIDCFGLAHVYDRATGRRIACERDPRDEGDK